MKKYVRRFFALTCVLLLGISLCGCSFWGEWDTSFLEDILGKTDSGKNYEGSQSVTYTLTGPTDFYEEPSFDSQILATYYEGHTVVYSAVVNINDVQWASTNEGWFVLSGSQPDALLITEANTEIILTQPVDVFAEPSLNSDVLTQLATGKVVLLTHITTAGNQPWGLCNYGWILLNDCCIELDTLNSVIGYGVVRDTAACFYSEPNIYSGVVGTPECGSRYSLLAVVEIDSLTWAYTTQGWMPTDAIYEEGTTGFRPCSAIVIDPTPLNVRIAPGTDKEILATLTYGDHVQILERINYNGSDWGFTGTGWIFMDLTEIQ